MWLLAHTQRTRRTDEIPFHLMAPKVCRVTKGAVTAKTSTLKTACLFKNHSSVPCPPPEQTVLASTAHSCCTPPSPAATTTSASQQQGRGCGHECRIMGNSQHILSVLNWMACSAGRKDSLQGTEPQSSAPAGGAAPPGGLIQLGRLRFGCVCQNVCVSQFFVSISHFGGERAELTNRTLTPPPLLLLHLHLLLVVSQWPSSVSFFMVAPPPQPCCPASSSLQRLRSQLLHALHSTLLSDGSAL